MGRDRMVLIVGLCVAIAVAGCAQQQPPVDTGDEGDGLDGSDGADNGDPPSGTPVTWTEHTFLGPILTDLDGRTLYVFTRDEPGTSSCTEGCAANWPPMTVDNVPAEDQGLAGRLGTTDRDDGSLQLTIDGRPVYYYASDEEAGDANGQGRGGVWFVIREADEPGRLNVDILDGPGEHDVVRAPGITYGPNATGYMVQPRTGETYPGVVLVHEWWGLNDNIRAMADALASHGYKVLAVDLFNGSVATTPDEARAQVGGLDQQAATSNLRAAVAHLRQANASPIGSLGWCFGGGQSLQLAISGETLGATVLYYGTPLVTDEDRLAAIDWPVLGVFGDQDGAIPLEQVEAFDSALTNLSIEHEVLVYEGVGHAFANPSSQAYGAAQAMDAWATTLEFLDANLKGSEA